MKIPFNKPWVSGREFSHIKAAVRYNHLSGDGLFTRKCEMWLKKQLHSRKVLLTPSCTAALEMTAILAQIKSGDEVILPSFTFTSTANAFVLRGARPVFVDVRPDTMNLDELQIESAITKKTKIICVVHYGGVPCRMDTILKVAKKHRLMVVEDAAQALGASFQGRPAGTMGELSAFSFHETKNVNCGEGGALVINQDRYRQRAEIIRHKGTNRAQFDRGMTNKYSWVDIGSSYSMSDLQGAFLYAQFKDFGNVQKKRKALYERYYEGLLSLKSRGILQLPSIPEDCVSSYHLFHVQVENQTVRSRFIDYLHRKNIHAVFHYFPLHLARMGQSFGYRAGQFPVTESAGKRLVRLPLFAGMTEKEQRYIINTVNRYWA